LSNLAFFYQDITSLGSWCIVSHEDLHSCVFFMSERLVDGARLLRAEHAQVAPFFHAMATGLPRDEVRVRGPSPTARITLSAQEALGE
jgi:hypothetical protein